MHIDQDILFTWGAVAKIYDKGECIFSEDERSHFYHQILEGKVKMVNINNDGKEFIQGIFNEGQSFGEPALCIDVPYPASAITQKESVIIKLSRENFMRMLDAYPEMQKKMILLLSQRLYNKALTAREVINNSPESRLLSFLKQIKKEHSKKEEKILIPHTRQELANLTGLRVETVIRTLSRMKKEKKVEIINHKLYF
jgi:CRP-like cAMP-binding protein